MNSEGVFSGRLLSKAAFMATTVLKPPVTISLGITVFKGEVDLSKVELLGIADQALYRAKQLGRNQIYYQPLTTSTCIE